MDGKSLNITEEKLNKLKEIIPEVFTEYKIDWEKLKAALGEDIEFKNERYVLNWAGKSDAFRVLQSPTTATLVPNKEESVNFDTTENVFIEGENLEVLRVLQKAYFGKIKMIYIDPPYNTGNDTFIYPDKFSETREEYLSRIGDKDETGYLTREGLFRKNSKDSGRYHSNGLSMMYPRLFLARNLLRDDGVIFVSIDDNEVHNLRLLMNEVFGEENFIANIVWQKKYAATNDAKGFSVMHDHIIVYQKSGFFERNLLSRTKEQDKPYKNDDNDGKGLWRSDNLLVRSFSPSGVFPIKNPKTGKEFYPPEGSCWRGNKKTIEKWLKDGRIFFGKYGNGAPQLKRYLNEVQQGRVPTTWWPFSEAGHNDAANKELKSLFHTKAPFDTPKPTMLIKQMLKIGSNNSDLILDFFSGSATTAHAVLDLNKAGGGNRKFILIQLPEPTSPPVKGDKGGSEAYKAGYKTIADIGKERIRRVIKKTKEELDETPPGLPLTGEEQAPKQDLEFKAFKLKESNFKIWRTKINTEEELVEQLAFHTDPLDGNAKTENVLYELLLKSGVPLTAKITHTPVPSPLTGKGAQRLANPEALSQRGVFKYNPKLMELARELRKNSTPMEKKLWENFLKERPHGFKFLRQKPIGNHILDFYCSELLLAVEVDGKIHETRKEYDKERDDFLNKCGIRVIRIPNYDAENDFDLVKKKISESINAISAEIKNLSPARGIEGVYLVNDTEIALLLEKVNNKIIKSVIELKPQKVVTLDRLFNNNDQLRTNTALQMKDAGIEFKVV